MSRDLRYDMRRIVRNVTKEWRDYFKKREVPFIRHYTTPVLHHVEKKDLSRIDTISIIWKVGTRYSKLAEKYYQDARLWWVIAQYNLKPTEAHVRVGDVIQIPTPIEEVLKVMRR